MSAEVSAILLQFLHNEVRAIIGVPSLLAEDVRHSFRAHLRPRLTSCVRTSGEHGLRRWLRSLEGRRRSKLSFNELQVLNMIFGDSVVPIVDEHLTNCLRTFLRTLRNYVSGNQHIFKIIIWTSRTVEQLVCDNLFQHC